MTRAWCDKSVGTCSDTAAPTHLAFINRARAQIIHSRVDCEIDVNLCN